MEKKSGIGYKWVIAGMCFLMVFTVLGFCSSSKTIYLAPITEALRIDRSSFSLADSCCYIAIAVVNAFFGSLIVRFGPRKLIFAGFLALIAYALCYATASRVWLFCLGGVFCGIGRSWTTTSMVGCLVGKWFREEKGTVMGAILASNGLGAALAVQIVSPIINEEGNPFGYRKAYFLIAAILAVTCVVVLLLYREAPAHLTEKPASSAKKRRGHSWTGMEFSQARRKAYFWLALFCILLNGVVLQGVYGVAAAHMRDVGLDAKFIAAVLSILSLILAGSKFMTGLIYDRTNLRVTVSMCYISALATIFFLSSITASKTGQFYAYAYAVAVCFALPLETIMLPIFAGDLFGEKDSARFLGFFVSANTAGYALGGPLMNLCYDRAGSYMPMFVICAVLMAATLAMMHIIISKAGRERAKIEKEQETRNVSI